MTTNKPWKILLSPFNKTQREWVKMLFIVLLIGLVGMLTMSALGAKNQSFHLLSLETGLGKYFYDGFSTIVISSGFTLLGMYFIKFTDKENKDV
jgi:hypothetical protein